MHDEYAAELIQFILALPLFVLFANNDFILMQSEEVSFFTLAVFG